MNDFGFGMPGKAKKESDPSGSPYCWARLRGLLALAADSLPGADCQVVVRSISRAALDLSCLLPGGVTGLRVAFAAPVEDPAALAGWLTARLRRIAGGGRD